MTIKTIAHKRLVVGEKKQRFGFRKTILGLCGALLGSTLLMAEAANNTHTVQAAESDPNQAKSDPNQAKSVQNQAKSVQIDNSAAKEAVPTKADAAKNNGTSTDASKASAKTPVEAKVNEGTKTANGLNGKIDQNLAKKEVPQLNLSLKQNEKAVADKSQDADKGATGKTVSTNATSTNEYSASASNLSKSSAANTSNGTAVNPNAKYEILWKQWIITSVVIERIHILLAKDELSKEVYLFQMQLFQVLVK